MKRLAGRNKLTAGLLLGLLLAVFGAAGSRAAEVIEESITLSPTSKRYKLDAGDTKKDTFTIINDGKVAYDFKVYAKPYSVNNEDYIPDFSSGKPMADLDKWVTVDRDTYHLEPGQSAKVPFTLNVSSDAAPGGHYGAIFAETQADPDVESTVVARQKRVGLIIYATVNGTLRENGEVISQGGPFLQLTKPLTTDVVVRNSGNSDFTAKTTMEVKSLFGGVKYQTKKEYVVLPDTNRRMSFEWNDVSVIGFYKVTLVTTVIDGGGSTTFYVLMAPVWAYLIAAVVALAGIMYWVQSRK